MECRKFGLREVFCPQVTVAKGHCRTDVGSHAVRGSPCQRRCDQFRAVPNYVVILVMLRIKWAYHILVLRRP